MKIDNNRAINRVSINFKQIQHQNHLGSRSLRHQFIGMLFYAAVCSYRGLSANWAFVFVPLLLHLIMVIPFNGRIMQSVYMDKTRCNHGPCTLYQFSTIDIKVFPDEIDVVRCFFLQCISETTMLVGGIINCCVDSNFGAKPGYLWAKCKSNDLVILQQPPTHLA